jgi:hypothetical protein
LLYTSAQAVSDYQKSKHKMAHPGKLVTQGLYRWSRHINYFAEVVHILFCTAAFHLLTLLICVRVHLDCFSFRCSFGLLVGLLQLLLALTIRGKHSNTRSLIQFRFGMHFTITLLLLCTQYCWCFQFSTTTARSQDTHQHSPMINLSRITAVHTELRCLHQAQATRSHKLHTLYNTPQRAMLQVPVDF